MEDKLAGEGQAAIAPGGKGINALPGLTAGTLDLKTHLTGMASPKCRIVITLLLAACVDRSPTSPGNQMAVTGKTRAHAIVTCSATGPGPTSCAGVFLDFSLYWPADHFGADFQAEPGSGVSIPITITFSQLVSSITITAYDPTTDGNTLQAFDSAGNLVGTAPIAGSGIAGVNVPQTVTVNGAGIKSIKLTPGSDDYVAYGGLSFVTQRDCETNDPVFDNPVIRQALKNLIMQSGAFNSSPETRQEIAGYVYAKNGTFEVRITPPSPSSPSTLCSSTPGGPMPQVGETVVGPVHTHPFAHGDLLPRVAGCGSNSNLTYAYDNRRYGGGSQSDWDFIQTPYDGALLPMFIIDKQEVFRLNGATPIRDRPRNPNRFRWNNATCPW